MNDIGVRESPIEGKGVFALKDFKSGERVLEWGERKVLSDEEFAALSEDEIRRYVSFVGGKHLLSGGPMKYINHSCDPNTKAQNNADVAIRDIAAGEEITSRYANPGEENIKCNCGASNCIGTL
jgi:uncharacterized protein